MTAQKLYDAEQAGEILQCNPGWLKKQAKLRRIPFTMIAGQYRFSEAHLEKIIHLFEQQPQEPGQQQSAPRRRVRQTDQSEETGVVTLTARRPRRPRFA